MEIKKGMYIRTREGIRKIESVWCTFDRYDLDRDIHNRYPEGNPLYKEDIERVVIGEPSFELIDLVEAGDWVNGIYVEKNNGKYLETLEPDYEESSLGSMKYIQIWNKDIYEVLTHEQYEDGVYRTGDKYGN